MFGLCRCSVESAPGVPAYSNYVTFPNTDITVDDDYSPQYLGSGGTHLSTDTLMTLCEDPAQGGLCSHFNTQGSLKTWPVNNTMQSYISTTTCGANAKLSFSNGTALSPPGTSYLVCTATPGTFVDSQFMSYATFNLPPFLIEQACDQDPACVGFVVDTAGTQGRLLALTSNNNPCCAASFIRLPPNA